MKTFCVQTLGCKVNHYEGEQIAALLRSRGLVEAEAAHADLRVVNSCSVTVGAASKSRQTARRLVRLPLLTDAGKEPEAGTTPPAERLIHVAGTHRPPAVPSSDAPATLGTARHARVIVAGCWATSDPSAASSLGGVDAVITHHADVAAELDRLLTLWRGKDREAGQPGPVASGHFSRPERGARHAPADSQIEPLKRSVEPPPERLRNDGWITEAGSPAGTLTEESKATSPEKVNLQIDAPSVDRGPINPKSGTRGAAGTSRLPLLGERQTGRQRAYLKVQDGCDAHCTYCIIPRLRPHVWSKPADDAVEEARRLVAAGHVEVVLTGVFLGAYGHRTALRRRRDGEESAGPIGGLVAALCTRVPGLRRLRLSSLEPGDLTGELVRVLRDHRQVVPHFHLPLQSGSDALLRRMNRQYGREDFLRMVDRVRAAFDRPALTTDVIVGFPGEGDDEFRETMQVVDHARFIHVHAFPYSPRPGTAAARWGRQFVHGPVVNARVGLLRARGEAHGLSFRGQFAGEVVEVLVEQDEEHLGGRAPATPHGRCERYFDVHFEHAAARPGDFARVRVDSVTPRRTHGTCLALERPAGGWS